MRLTQGHVQKPNRFVFARRPIAGVFYIDVLFLQSTGDLGFSPDCTCALIVLCGQSSYPLLDFSFLVCTLRSEHHPAFLTALF